MKNVLVVLMGLGFAASVSASPVEAGHTSAKYDLKVGQKIVVTFASNPSTGFGWYIKNDESKEISKAESNRASIIKYTSRHIAAKNPEHRVGVPGSEEFEFRASEPGLVFIRMEYLRPWDPSSVSESRVFEFNVR